MHKPTLFWYWCLGQKSHCLCTCTIMVLKLSWLSVGCSCSAYELYAGLGTVQKDEQKAKFKDTFSVTDTLPRFQMESIRSPDTPDKVYGLLIDSWWTPDGLQVDSWYRSRSLSGLLVESIKSLYTLPGVHQESYQDFVDFLSYRIVRQ